MENFADLYTDYLISSTSLPTATGMSSLLAISNDKITRSLSKGNVTIRIPMKKLKKLATKAQNHKETLRTLCETSCFRVFVAEIIMLPEQ